MSLLSCYSHMNERKERWSTLFPSAGLHPTTITVVWNFSCGYTAIARMSFAWWYCERIVFESTATERKKCRNDFYKEIGNSFHFSRRNHSKIAVNSLRCIQQACNVHHHALLSLMRLLLSAEESETCLWEFFLVALERTLIWRDSFINENLSIFPDRSLLPIYSSIARKWNGRMIGKNAKVIADGTPVSVFSSSERNARTNT